MNLPIFDPFAGARDTAQETHDEDGTIFPGVLLQQQIKGAEAIIKAASGMEDERQRDAVQRASLAVMNGWYAFGEAAKEPAGDAAQRRLVMGSYMAGYSAARLHAMTAAHARAEETDQDKWIQQMAAQAAARARTNAANERKAIIRKEWATDQYVSRDRCAYAKWEEIGFPSFRTAREALNNTPDPLR